MLENRYLERCLRMRILQSLIQGEEYWEWLTRAGTRMHPSFM